MFCKKLWKQNKNAITTVFFKKIQSRFVWFEHNNLSAENWKQQIHIKKNAANYDKTAFKQFLKKLISLVIFSS